jgi:hypothetical protein
MMVMTAHYEYMFVSLQDPYGEISTIMVLEDEAFGKPKVLMEYSTPYKETTQDGSRLLSL